MDACESPLNRNKIDSFLKRMVTGDEIWVTYDDMKRKWLWSKSGEAAQTVAKPGLTARKVLLCVWWDWRESSTMSCSPMAKRSIRTCTANNWTAWMQHSRSSDGRFFSIHRIVGISHQVITTYFCPWRTSLVVGSWPQESPVKIGSSSFLTIGKRASIKGTLWSWHLVGKSSSNKTAHIWLKSHYCNQFYTQLKIQ